MSQAVHGPGYSYRLLWIWSKHQNRSPVSSQEVRFLLMRLPYGCRLRMPPQGGRTPCLAFLRFVSLMRHPKCLSSTACSLRTVVRRGFTSGLPTRHTPWSANAQTIRRCGLNMSLGLFRHFKGRVSMTASSKTQRTASCHPAPKNETCRALSPGGRSMSPLSRLAPNRQCLQCAMAEYHRLQLKRFHCSASTPSAASSATIACLRALSSSTAKRCSRRRKSTRLRSLGSGSKLLLRSIA